MVPNQKKDPRVIYEDPQFLVVNKPAGMIVHPIKNNPSTEPTLTAWLLARYPEIKTVGDDPAVRPGIVHRLDKDTSGVMLVARTQEYFEYLKSLFASGRIHKTYIAVVIGSVRDAAGIIEKAISMKSGTTRRTVREGKMRKEAITEYRVVRHIPAEEGRAAATLLKVTPRTGRTHQIRVHLASISHPIAGDPLYGRTHDGFSRLMLHAYGIEFEGERGKKVRFEAEPPEEFQIANRHHLVAL